MSQEKVDRYKEEKANRKETMKKQKRQRVLRNTAVGIVCAAVVGWVGYSGYQSLVKNQPVETAEIDYSSVVEYLTGLTEAE